MLPKGAGRPQWKEERFFRRPYAFHLERIDGAWKLTDNLFLEIAAEPPGQAAAKAGS